MVLFELFIYEYLIVWLRRRMSSKYFRVKRVKWGFRVK